MLFSNPSPPSLPKTVKMSFYNSTATTIPKRSVVQLNPTAASSASEVLGYSVRAASTITGQRHMIVGVAADDILAFSWGQVITYGYAEVTCTGAAIAASGVQIAVDGNGNAVSNSVTSAFVAGHSRLSPLGIPLYNKSGAETTVGAWIRRM